MIYIVRHGQTDWNKKHLIQGSTDMELNAKGIRQARVTKEKLKNIEFDAVFCSPLKRAVETCKILDKGSFVLDSRIMERNFGDFEGKSGISPVFFRFWKEERQDEFPSVEKISDMKSRVFGFLDEVISNHKKKNVLVVCHSGTAIFIKMYFEKLPEKLKYHKYRIKNCDYIKYEI